MKNLKMSKISTKNILKKIFKGSIKKKVKKKVAKKKVAKTKKIIKVKTVMKGKGIKVGQEITIGAWHPSVRVPPIPGPQGNHPIPNRGDSITVYLHKKSENNYTALLASFLVSFLRREP